MNAIQTPPPKNGHKIRAERTRERIIAHAYDRILSEGFTSLRMEDLAFALGMSKATIYRNFRSKEDLLDVCLHRHIEHNSRLMSAVMEHPGTAMERATKMVKLMGRELQTVSGEFLDDIRCNRPLRFEEITSKRRKIMSSYIKRIIEQGQEEGTFRSDVPAYLPTTMLWVSMDHMTNPTYLKNHALSFNEMVSTLMHIIFEGLINC